MSETLGQSCTNVIQMFCVCWVTTLVQHWRWWGFRQICCVRAVTLRNSQQNRRKGGMGSLAFMAVRLTRMRVVWIQCRSLMGVKREILKFEVFEADLLSDSIFLGLTFVNRLPNIIKIVWEFWLSQSELTGEFTGSLLSEKSDKSPSLVVAILTETSSWLQRVTCQAVREFPWPLQNPKWLRLEKSNKNIFFTNNKKI